MAEKQVALVSAEGVFLRVETVDDAAPARQGMLDVLPPDTDAPRGAWAWRDSKWLRHCALLDPNGIYRGMVAVPPAELTALHLPAIAECDLTPGHARWVTDSANQFGGHFDPLPPAMRPKENGAPTDHQAFAALLDAIQNQGLALPVEAIAWRAWFAKTMDGKGSR